jgi:outer membrane protein assembly factor BamB
MSSPLHCLYLAGTAFAVAVSLAACGGAVSVPAPAQPVGLSDLRFPPPGKVFNWLQPGIDSTHIADNETEKKLKIKTVAKIKRAWSFATGAGVGWTTVTDGSVAYANSGDGFLYAINVAKGSQRWRFETSATGERALTSSAVGGDFVYAGCNVGGSTQQQGLCAVDRSTGKLSWSWYADCNCQPSAFILSGPVVSGSTVVFGYYTGGAYGKKVLIALDAATGTLLWQATAGSGSPGGGMANSVPAIDNANVYVGTDYGLCSLQLSNGALNWCNGPDDLGIAPAVAGGVVYANTSSSGFYAFNEMTGAQIWQYTPSQGGGGFFDPPAIAGNTVYFSTIDSGPIYALNASNGSLLFTAGAGSFNTETLSSPSLAGGVLYVTCNSGLCAYNASTGALLISTGGIGAGSPSIANGRVYFGCGISRSSGGPIDVCAYRR